MHEEKKSTQDGETRERHVPTPLWYPTQANEELNQSNTQQEDSKDLVLQRLWIIARKRFHVVEKGPNPWTLCLVFWLKI